MTDIHFAVSQEFGGGWQVQVVVANTRATPIADWLLAMDLPLANYLEAVYTVQHDAARQLRECPPPPGRKEGLFPIWICGDRPQWITTPHKCISFPCQE